METTQQQPAPPAVASKDGLSSPLVDESKILKWWRCKRTPSRGAAKSRSRWEVQRFTFGQRKNMEKYYEVKGPFDTKYAADLAA